jgi:glutamine synthetase
MIISHKLRFIFAAIPKTGTHSVRRALRVHLGPDDEEQVRLFVEKSLPYAELAAMRHGHISLEQLRPHIGSDIFEGYFKFAFVRNPFDRFVSYCSFMTRDTGAFDQDPRRVMRVLLAQAPMHHVWFAPQHQFVMGADGAMLADELGRVEEMQSWYNRFCARMGIPSTALEKANASRRGDYRDYYDDQLVEAVSRVYARDLDLFGYKF